MNYIEDIKKLTEIQQNIIQKINSVTPVSYYKFHSFNAKTKTSQNIFMAFCFLSETKDLFLNEEEINVLLTKTSSFDVDETIWNNLMYALRFGPPLNESQWKYLFKTSDLELKDENGFDVGFVSLIKPQKLSMENQEIINKKILAIPLFDLKERLLKSNFNPTLFNVIQKLQKQYLEKNIQETQNKIKLKI